MSNIIELNIAEIDTVVGGASAIQAATTAQATINVRPTAQMASRPVIASTSNVNINVMLARLEAQL